VHAECFSASVVSLQGPTPNVTHQAMASVAWLLCGSTLQLVQQTAIHCQGE
jgi:hypothetical protein